MRKTFKRILGRTVLSALGFKEEGERPEAPSFVLIAAPHTSNWDMPLAVALSYVYDVPMRFAGKHTLFRWPYGWFFKALGGIPIVRHERGNRVEMLAALFEEDPNLVLTVQAEGTRSLTKHWKSGFYHIAREANVPIVCAYLDFERKRGGFGITVYPTGDIEADMDKFREFYRDKVGKYPEKFGPVRLRSEMEAEEKAEKEAAQ